MQNFNTNQSRQLYVAGAVKEATVDPSTFDKLDIALGKTATGQIFFRYKNAEGNVTRTDLVDVKKITSVKNTPASQLTLKLRMAKVEADSNVIDFGATSSFIGKTINLIITIHGLFDYDDDNTKTVLVSLVGNKTNLASKLAFTKALAVEAAKNLVNKVDPAYPLVRVFYGGSEVSPTATADSLAGTDEFIKLVQGPQKWSRGKLTGEPCSFSLYGKAYSSLEEELDWLTSDSHKLVASDIAGYTVISGDYKLADLEYFALGERGDTVRDFAFPNNYEHTYAIEPGKSYSVLSIEYYWSGGAETVQKSPRLLQIAAPAAETDDVCTKLYDAVVAAMS